MTHEQKETFLEALIDTIARKVHRITTLERELQQERDERDGLGKLLEWLRKQKPDDSKATGGG